MLKKLFLDLNNFKANLGSVERGDSIELNIKLLDSEDYSRSKFRVLGAKADGKYVEQIEGINLEEKDLKIVLEDQFVNCEGIVKLELNVVSCETEITTKEFYFFVSNTMNAEIIDSADSIPTLEKVSKYVDDAVNNLDALKEASEDITIINSEFKEAEIKRKANELLRERSEKERVRLESIRTTEEADRIKAEAERKEAENNRKVAESNRKLAENTRKTNEANRVRAELNRQSLFEENEEIRNENENLRIEAEKERKLAFSNNNKFESERVEAEKLRCIAEDKRVIAEKTRANAEEERIKAETRRENTYTDFNDSEVERKNNEANRVRAEAERVNAESGRNELFNTNEEKRNSTFIESERTRERAFNEAQNDRNLTFEESERVREEAFKVSEAARNEAEEGRVEAESERVKSEKARVLADEERNNTFTQNETNRNTTFTQNEEERKGIFEEAENARKVAESKRVKVETSRVEAEKLRVVAETGRVEAESLRVTAEEERVAAETKREEGFNEFEGRISANTKELKNARSATTGEEFNSLDERIDHEVDRLNKKIDVTMLQQEDKENHVIENSVEGMTTDMVIKGRTLNNLIVDGHTKKEIGVSTTSKAQYSYIFRLKENTKYTVIWEIEDKNDDMPYFIEISNFENKGQIKSTSKNKGIGIINTTTGSLSKLTCYYISSQVGGGRIKNVMVLEGDWTNKEIPSFFEGIKSFGEAEGNKISILSRNKNLFDIEESKKISVNTTFNSDGSIKFFQGAERFVVVNRRLKENTQYTLSFNKIKGRCNFSAWYSDGTTSSSNDLSTFTTLPNKTVIAIKSSQVGGEESVLTNLQLEEEMQKTSYVGSKQDKKDILLSSLGFDEGIRGVNSIRDELNFIRNVAIKKIHKYTLTAELNWYIYDLTEDIRQFYIQPLEPLVVDDRDAINCISSTLPSCKYNDRTNLVNHIYCNANLLAILKPKSTTLEEFKQWLRDNPTTVYYKLAEPVETPLDENINLKTFNEKTYVSFENAISGTSSFKAPVDTTATIARLNRENRALEEENKTLRQDFESTTLSLTDSDLELVKQNVDMDFRLMEVEFALDIPQSTLSSKFKKKGEVKSMARTPYQMLKIVILSGDYDREDYIHKVGKYYERGRMTKDEHDELMSLMTADEVISK
ncbi:hypothetical protein QTH18_05540 [Clostridium perfringens]|nr:hypothetical protein [Clostridium perfringens]